MAVAEVWASGTLPVIGDTKRMLMIKEILATQGISLSVSGVTGVYAWDGTGAMPTASGPALLLGKGSIDGQMWRKTSSGTNNTDWEQF